jgi:NAD(P)-dependent dehydrogenase (short-subunit alcohol dehydrogenase family)
MTETGRLSGRAAIVTGAAQGIGRGIATALAQEGAGLVLVGRTPATLQQAADSITSSGAAVCSVEGSVSDRATADAAVREAVRAFGGVDVVVNCAHTYTPHASVDRIPEADFRTELETGFFGTVHFMQAAFPHLREKGGSIINLGSQAALQGTAERGAYAATKEAIRGLSRSAARDWGRYRVRVNVLCPVAMTPALEERVSADARARVAQAIPLRHIGDALQDVAPVAVFLASDEARYVTGQTINVDGGLWMF